MNPHVGSIAVAFVQLLASMLSGLLIDTVGRIPLLIISSVFMSLALASFGSYAYYDKENKMLGGDTDWIPLLCVLVFTIAFSLGKWHTQDICSIFCTSLVVGADDEKRKKNSQFFSFVLFAGISPISSLLVGELFPLEYRGIGSSIATSFSYFCAFLSVKTFIDFQVCSVFFHTQIAPHLDSECLIGSCSILHWFQSYRNCLDYMVHIGCMRAFRAVAYFS